MMNTKDFTFLSIDGCTSDTKLILTSHIHSIINTMKDWCTKNQGHGNENSRGFVIYAYSQVLKLSENVLKYHLHRVTCEDFHETVLVYNPTKQIFLLIRIAIDKNLEDEIKLSTNDMMKFVLTFFDVLDKSRVKLINLLVTGEEYQLVKDIKCGSCKHQIISTETFSSSKSFDKWWEKKENKFSISVIHSDLNENVVPNFLTRNKNFVPNFLTRIGDIVNYLQLHYSIKQLTEAAVMTLEQTKTVYFPCKHRIIENCNETEKSIVARKSVEIVSRSLKRDDSLYYIFSGGECLLQEEIKRYSKINVFHNVTQKSESAILQQILHNDSKKGNINVIFDGFNGENLDKNSVNKRIKDSNIIFIPQPLTTEGRATDIRVRVSKFEMLENMKFSEELNWNARKAMERCSETEKENGKNLTTAVEDPYKTTSNSKETKIG